MNTTEESLKNYYKILDIPENASEKLIRESYFRLKNIYTSKNSATYSLLSEGEIKETLAEIEEAFCVLNTPKKRENPRLTLENKFLFEDKRGIRSHSKEAIQNESSQQTANQSQSNWVANEFSSFNKFLKKYKASGVESEFIQNKIQTLIDTNEIACGELFQKIRALTNITMDELQEHTKISLNYLKALEENRFDQLPQSIYVKGFLKSYLTYLGVKNSQPLINDYIKRLDDWQSSRGKK